MNILVDTSFILRNKTGVGNYIQEIFKYFVKLNLPYETISADFLWKFPFKELPFKYIPYAIWLNTKFYIKTLTSNPSYVIDAHYFFPVLTSKKTHYIGTIYDLVCFHYKETMSTFWVFCIQTAMRLTVKKADTILTISETIKQEIIEQFPNVDQKKIKIIYPTYNQELYDSTINDSSLLEKYNIDKGKYLLAVATLNKRKNTENIVKAFYLISKDYPDLKLVLVGDSNRFTNKMDLDFSNSNIVFTGYVKDEELPTLYKNALAFVFPSLYEGFGIPILEAQASKTPVIATDIPIFREVAGDSVLYCSSDAQGLSAKMQEIINNSELREILIQKGLQNIKRFSLTIIQSQIKGIFK